MTWTIRVPLLTVAFLLVMPRSAARADDEPHEGDEHESEAEHRMREYQEKQHDAADQNAHQAEHITSAVAGFGGGGNKARGSSWLFHLELGLAGGTLPVYTTTSGSDVATKNETGYAGGMGMLLNLTFWPYFGRYAGVGLLASSNSGGMALAGGGTYYYSGMGGLVAYAGREDVVVAYVEGGGGYRGGGTSADSGGGIIDSTTVGSGGYAFGRFAGAIRVCLTRESKNQHDGFCEASLDTRAGFEALTGFSPGTVLAPVVGAKIWQRRGITVDLEFGWNYPTAGQPASTTTGYMFMASIAPMSTWDWFGAPY